MRCRFWRVFLACENRQTEEGRRRRQQQQSSSTSGDGEADATATTAPVPSAAPTADNAPIAGGGARARKALGVSGVIPDNTSGTAAAAGSFDEQSGRAEQREAPRWGDEKKGDRPGAEEESSDRSEKQPGDEAFPTWNGGECRDGLYAWNQSIREASAHASRRLRAVDACG